MYIDSPLSDYTLVVEAPCIHLGAVEAGGLPALCGGPAGPCAELFLAGGGLPPMWKRRESASFSSRENV